MESESGNGTNPVPSTKGEGAILMTQQFPSTLHFYLTWVVPACVALIFGYQAGITDGVTIMTPFLDKNFTTISGTEWATKYCKFNGGAFLLLGVATNVAAKDVSTYFVAQIFLGLGVGYTNHSLMLYLSEMVPHRNHGWVNNWYQLIITIGFLLANFIYYHTSKIEGGWGWLLSLSLAALPALIITIGSFYLPGNLIKELKILVSSHDEGHIFIKNPWKDIKKKKYRPHLSIAILMPFFQQMTGITFITSFAPVLFKTLGADNDTSLKFAMIIVLVYACMTLVAITTPNVDYDKSSSLFLMGGIPMFMAQVGLGIIIWIRFGKDNHVATNSIDDLVFICSYVISFVLPWGPIGWLNLTEILFPHEIRPAAQSINFSLNMLFASIIAKVSVDMLCHLKFEILFFYFAVFTAIGTIFFYYFVPEIKGKSVEEMSHVWKQHWYWGKYFLDHEEVGREMEMTQIPEEGWVVINKED